jgi:hypothetical protein
MGRSAHIYGYEVINMGTRLLSEHLIKKHYPHLRYIRIHTVGRNLANIYAWNEDLQLSDREIADLKRFASGYLCPYVCFKIRSYHLIETDKVPQVDEVPQSIVQIAMNRSLDEQAILAVLNNVLSNGDAIFNSYDPITGTIHFEVHSETIVNDIEKELIFRYLYELIPLGSSFTVTFG